MFFPTLKKTDMEKVTVTEFPGLDRRESVRMGGFRKMKKLCQCNGCQKYDIYQSSIHCIVEEKYLQKYT